MIINAKELDLMLEALDKGDAIFVHYYGKAIRMNKREKEAARNAIRAGSEVPEFIMRMVCMGLEYLYFCDNRQGEGIEPLLRKLADMCGYQRFGMAMIGARGCA